MAVDPGKISVQADKPGAKIGPGFYGIMTEEINYSYDGGIYGELIQNRIFKNPVRRGRRDAATAPTAAPAGPNIPHWALVSSEGATGEMSLDTTDPVNTTALTTSLKLNITAVGSGQRVGVANDGYWGIPARPNSTYQVTFYAKGSDGFSGPLTLDIESGDGKTVHATATIDKITRAWQRYSATLKTGALEPTADCRFVISAASTGTLNLNLVSLFPSVFKERTGAALGGRPVTGFRPDLMQLLADMHPAFLRLPGGNYVEGSNFANRFDFKATIGPWEDRPTHMSPWGYRSSDGMGLLEYLEWCEDVQMDPLLAVYAGLNLDNSKDVKTGDALKPLIQDALDEIEYVSGDASTVWGSRRAKDGHTAPFKLNFVEIGNEDGLNKGATTYRGPDGRFALFYNAIKAKYPDLQIIATINPGVKHDVIDDHFYMSFNAALNNATLYDRRPRTAQDGSPAPRVFVGEWATRDGNATPSFHAALTDAAFLTGLERNADLVIMSCYAPLFVNLNPGGMQWATDLIGYNAIGSFGSPSYYVQKMFYNNKGDQVLPITVAPQLTPGAGASTQPAPGNGRNPAPKSTLFASASHDDATGDIILKVVNAAEAPQQMQITLNGVSTIGKTATMQMLTGGLKDMNSLSEPMKVSPKSSSIDASADFVQEFPATSVSVIRFSTR